MPNVDDFDDTPDTIVIGLSRRDLEQILTAMENWGDDTNSDPRWGGLFDRLTMHTEWDRGR